MNRSKRIDSFSSTSLHVARGALSIATTWLHPQRGWVDCPAHPLLSAHARRAGFVVETLPWREPGPRGEGQAPATTALAVSYERPEGGHRGLALAARDDDAEALAFARHQIEAWATVLRTRRVLYVSAAPDAGPTRTASGGGWLVCGCRADVGCPSAGYAERSLYRSADRGDEAVIVGEPVTGFGAWPREAPAGRVTRAATLREAEALAVADPDRLVFVVAPGAVVSDAAGVLRVLRRRFPRLRGQHPGEWCYTMDDLYTAAGSVLAQSDALLVTGRGDGPLARTALVQAARAGVRARDLVSLDRLGPQDIDGATIAVLDTAARPAADTGAKKSIGPAAGAGPAAGPMERPDGRTLVRILGGLGPVSHVRRLVGSQTETETGTEGAAEPPSGSVDALLRPAPTASALRAAAGARVPRPADPAAPPPPGASASRTPSTPTCPDPACPGSPPAEALRSPAPAE